MSAELMTVLVVIACFALLGVGYYLVLYGYRRGQRVFVRDFLALQKKYADARLEREELRQNLTDLMFAARPLAEKTAWSSSSPYNMRVLEAERNERAEALRVLLHKLTGATLREETLEEAAPRMLDPEALNRLAEERMLDAERAEEEMGVRPLGGGVPPELERARRIPAEEEHGGEDADG